MKIFNKKYYRVIADETEDYIVDLSLNNWTYLCGIQAWFFPVFAYPISGQKIAYKQNKIFLVITFILYIIMMIALFMHIKIWENSPIFLSNFEKMKFCLIIYILSGISKFILGKIAHKKFIFHNYKTNEDIVKLKIHFKTKLFVFRLMFFNLLGNFVIMGGLVVGLVFGPKTEPILPYAIIPIYIFVSYSEMTKTPFLRKDIKKIEILEGKNV